MQDKTVLISFALTFILTVVLEKLLIPVLARLKMGQKILEIGPSWHMSKQGTPTMGGLAFLLSVTAVSLIFGLVGGVSAGLVLTALFALANGLIGAFDDLMKLRKKQNEGLSAAAKFFLQLAAASVYLVLLSSFEIVNTELYIPFVKTSVDIGRLYYPFALLVLTGFGNAVNLTDGLDGLCSSVTASVMLYFAFTCIALGNFDGSVISLAVLGGVLAFLIFNFHPAKVFMGDTGSLFLGSSVAGVALISGKNTAIFIVGAVYLAEASSVILQVLYYKATKKRLFLMAPIHHHFEKKGICEVRITLMFTAVTLLLVGISHLFV